MGFIWFYLRKGCACFPDKATSGTTTPRLPTALEGVYGDRFPPPSLPVRPAFVLGASRLSYSSLDGVLFDKTQTTLIRFPFGRLGDYTIPDSVTRIEYSAFMGCGGLTSVTIPDSVTSIGRAAFIGCRSLTSVTIPDSVTSIGDRAFSGCSSLTSVTIPDSVTSVGASAFRDCESLERIVFEGDAAEVGEAAFRDLSSNAKIFINPEAKGFGSRFEGLPVEFLPKEVEISTVSTGAARSHSQSKRSRTPPTGSIQPVT